MLLWHQLVDDTLSLDSVLETLPNIDLVFPLDLLFCFDIHLQSDQWSARLSIFQFEWLLGNLKHVRREHVGRRRHRS